MCTCMGEKCWSVRISSSYFPLPGSNDINVYWFGWCSLSSTIYNCVGIKSNSWGFWLQIWFQLIFDAKVKKKQICNLHTYAICPKVCGHLTFSCICASSPNCGRKVGSAQVYKMALYAVALQLPFTGTERLTPTPAWKCSCAQSKLYKDISCQAWSKKNSKTITEIVHVSIQNLDITKE